MRHDKGVPFTAPVGFCRGMELESGGISVGGLYGVCDSVLSDWKNESSWLVYLLGNRCGTADDHLDGTISGVFGREQFASDTGWFSRRKTAELDIESLTDIFINDVRVYKTHAHRTRSSYTDYNLSYS